MPKEWGDGIWNGFDFVCLLGDDVKFAEDAHTVNPIQVVQLPFYADLKTRNGKRM
jgi:hypothetical protein